MKEPHKILKIKVNKNGITFIDVYEGEGQNISTLSFLATNHYQINEMLESIILKDIKKIEFEKLGF